MKISNLAVTQDTYTVHDLHISKQVENVGVDCTVTVSIAMLGSDFSSKASTIPALPEPQAPIAVVRNSTDDRWQENSV